jgi:type VI secretion system protein
MTLILSVPGRTKLDNGESAQLLLDRHGAVIGRSAHADWSLPDPKNHVSSRHCEISYRNGVYLLSDRSTNGTFVNGSAERLGAMHAIRDGDRITIGGYELLASLPDEHGRSGAPMARETGAAPDAGWEDWAPASDADGPSSDAWSGAGVDADVESADPAAARASHSWTDPAPVRDTSPWASEPRKADAPPASDIWGQLTRDNDIAWVAEDFSTTPDVMAAWSPPLMANVPPEPDKDAAFDAASPPTNESAISATTPAEWHGWEAFVKSAGLPIEMARSPQPALLAAAGAALRQLVTGLVLMVEARARAKAQLGAEGTSLELDGNNPLKFIRSPDRALLQLLEPAQLGFMPAGRAIEDAFQDLQAHQLATLGAMSGALHATLARFAPAAIRDRQQARKRWRRWLPGARDAALWRAYEQQFEGVIRGADEAFMDVFAKEFRGAYEHHVAEMKRR